MKKFSIHRLQSEVVFARKKKRMSQQQLANAAGMNRAMISRLESGKYIPSIAQLDDLCNALGLEPSSFFVNDTPAPSGNTLDNKVFPVNTPVKTPANIAVAGTGYVGLSLAVLLSQHHHVTAVDIVPEKVDMINNRKSPIRD